MTIVVCKMVFAFYFLVNTFNFLKQSNDGKLESLPKTRFGNQGQDRKGSYHVRHISELFCSLVVLTLG